MAEEKKESGWLSKIFWGAVKVATIGLVAAVAWQMFLDPLFFPILHDPTNTIGQAWMHMINSNFGWIPQHAGLAKEPGLLSGAMNWLLSDHMNIVSAGNPATTVPFVDSLIPGQ